MGSQNPVVEGATVERNQKAQIIERLKAKTDRAQIAVVTDFKGLKVEELTDLRIRLRKAGVDYQVVKNTLARIALEGGPHAVLREHLKENCALALGYEDPVLTAKVVADFLKVNKKFVLRFGSLEGTFMDSKGVQDLSRLPGKPEMLARMLGTLNAVPTNFVSLLANVPRGLLNVLTALKEKREQGEAA
jgi:large subunit ribosomal protein L10